MSRSSRRVVLALLVALSFGLLASPAFAWEARRFNAIDGGEYIYGAVTVCVKSAQKAEVRWRIDDDTRVVRRRAYWAYLDYGCTRLQFKTHDDFSGDLYYTRIRVDVQKSPYYRLSNWHDLRVYY
jgi:hypothetical protein